MADRVEALVIGTGFGGAVTACRLSKKWEGKVMVLERGKRYDMGAFPRTPHDLGRNFWYLEGEKKRRPRHVKKTVGKMRKQEGGVGESHGMFDVRNYKHMDVVMSAGYGGGSLIYANVFLLPPDRVFDDRWPGTAKRRDLDPFYAVAKKVLGAQPVPDPRQPGRRKILRTERFQEAAKAMGRNSELLDLMIFFGNDYAEDQGNAPLDIGLQEKNRYGAVQTSCTYCAECDIGCNYHAKNTLDLNYLFVAEHRYKAAIKTEHLAEEIVPVNAEGRADPNASGDHGYRVKFRNLVSRECGEVLANRVVVSAGALGSTELLLQAKERHGTLPRISGQLGKRFSGNGDFLAFAIDSADDQPINPNYGPVITQRIDYNLFDAFDPDRAFVVEDASYPPLLAWLGEGLKPRFLWGGALWRTLHSVVKRYLAGNTYGPFTYAIRNLLASDVSYHTGVMLCMGVDKSNGKMTLDSHGELEIDWPYKDSMKLYQGILEAAKDFTRQVGGKKMIPLPTWYWPFRNNITVHQLGGCFIGNSIEEAVTSAERDTFGQVFKYPNLYVADGALCPSAVGANPCATIAALSEMVAKGITGIEPEVDL